MSGACPPADDLTAMALGALAPDDEARLTRHTDGCRRCLQELHQLAPAIGVLAESVEQYEAPPALRTSIMEIVRAEADEARAETATAARAHRGPTLADRLAGFILRPVSVAVATAFLAAGVGGYVLNDGGSGPGARTVPVTTALAGAEGSLSVEGDLATLKTSGVPGLPRGSVYQVWVRSGQAVVPAATFIPHEDGTATTAIDLIKGTNAIMVTREEGAGRKAPHLPSLISAQLD